MPWEYCYVYGAAMANDTPGLPGGFSSYNTGTVVKGNTDVTQGSGGGYGAWRCSVKDKQQQPGESARAAAPPRRPARPRVLQHTHARVSACPRTTTPPSGSTRASNQCMCAVCGIRRKACLTLGGWASGPFRSLHRTHLTHTAWGGVRPHGGVNGIQTPAHHVDMTPPLAPSGVVSFAPFLPRFCVHCRRQRPRRP